MEFPDNIGECIDLMLTTRDERLEIQREADAKIKILKTKEDELEAHILQNLQDIGLEGGKGSLATVAVKATIVPTVKDWDAFYAHIRETGSFDLLQKRPTVSAYRERLDAGEIVPGVEPFKKLELTLNRR